MKYTTAKSVIVKDADPFEGAKTQSLVKQLHRDGYLFLKGVLTPKEVDMLREVMERKYQDPKMHDEA